jgi:hypothetical protein
LNNKEPESSKEKLEKQKKLEEHRKLMQPSYKKYGIRKNPNEVLPVYNNEERFHANAGKVNGCNMVESGGAQFRSLSNRSSSISPIRADGPNTAEPMDIGPVFTAITEVMSLS